MLYAFAHTAGEVPVIRYEKASRMAELAEAAEADYPGTNRYHLDIAQFDIDIHRLTGFLDQPD